MMNDSLAQALAMLRVLLDVGPDALQICRKAWRKETGKLKTERSAAKVPLIEPLRSLLERHRAQSPEGFILQNASGKPLDLDSINTRIIVTSTKSRGYCLGRVLPSAAGNQFARDRGFQPAY
jgi:hypothetical protein